MSDPINAAEVAGLMERLIREPNPLVRRRLLLGARPLWRPETAVRFYDEALRLIHVDLSQAERMARSAVWLAENMKDRSARAAGLRALGHVLSTRRRYPAGMKLYRQAIAIYEELGQEVELARTLNGALQTLFYLGDYPEAQRFAEQARE